MIMVTICLLCFFLLFLSQLATITAFVVDVPSTRLIREQRITNHHHHHHHRFSLSSALSQGFGGTASSSSSTSGKKKKNAKKKYNSKSQSYYPDVSGTTKLLLEWLDEEEVEGLEGVEIGFRKKEEDGDGLLRGVFAKRDIQAGEYIMAVPFVSTLLVDESFEVSSSDNDKSSGDSGRDNSNRRTGEPIVGLRFWQKFLNKSDDKKEEKYEAYLDCIPLTSDDPNFDSTPDFWSEKEIQQLEVPIVVENMLSRKHAIAELVETPQQNNVNGNDDNVDDDDNGDVPTSISTLQQACWIMQSRGFSTYKKAIDLDGNIGLLSRVVLIPFIDMLNHASRTQSNAEIQVIETKEYDESFYALVANQHIPKRTEIKINYGTGEETSFELFCRYGFFAPTDDDEFFLENQEKERAALEMLLLPEGNTTTTTSPWSTSLKDDQDMIGTKIGRTEPMHSILSLRIYAKKLLLSSSK